MRASHRFSTGQRTVRAVYKHPTRYYGTDHLHFINCSCYRRQPWLASRCRRDLLLKVLEGVRQRYKFVVVGYVVMPDHIHLLISEPERAILRKSCKPSSRDLRAVCCGKRGNEATGSSGCSAALRSMSGLTHLGKLRKGGPPGLPAIAEYTYVAEGVPVIATTRFFSYPFSS
ncbi:MAG TPA: transposase [Terriglobales bacterium]|nr:transposase [Terriglobales bacterium]